MTIYQDEFYIKCRDIITISHISFRCFKKNNYNGNYFFKALQSIINVVYRI